METSSKKHQARNEPDVDHFQATADQAEESVNQNGENGNRKTEEQQTQVQEEAVNPAELQQKLDETSDRLLRLQAEFDNYRKRTAKERLELILTASEEVIRGMLPVLDDCQRALETLEKLGNADPHSVEGVQLIYSKLLTYLQGKGLKAIQAKGQALDTDFHCAVAKVPVKEKKMKGKIVDVALEGYTLNGKVIRFANVIVGE
ncbi:MAG: nucleotide exchange factor GrpE [Bacteroidales bacterium]|jgi:molecular chaperone GrpE|nr:nucleotide exchange factor GrpE [Bacteroidales bacterium]MDD2264924.1 nucleotide exchange factor GrpE [Bacteroidales bacterium]MDD2831918.1 nucleotide exchange factor GrpE [Bacteroidales bacterium]MDD3209370.1 nucleotide exchange factor GrpE [Bacteroidales bacterium]MDD3698036.1 nucleotide exchange factor GrpE [Bacteroidales bacterium]